MVSHGDDVVRVFAFPYALENGSEEDEKVTQILLNMLANFIIYGSPQEDQSFGHLDDISEWKPIKPGTPVGYFNISVNPSMVYKPYRFKVWKKII
ncbi:hypothetical protein SK128_016225 [Halocaridina rubra]|uniref:Carboxylesterase type B domain-containing protein n=1 Tax=Halocaridina rubra TaxID=373956 RepID=A0AAN8ZXI2_HALRR